MQCLNCILQSSQFYYGYYPFPSDVALKTFFFLFFANDCTENVMRVQCRTAKIHKTVLQCTSPLKLYWMHYGMSFSNRANHTYEFVGCVTSGPVCRRFRHSVMFTVRCADSACLSTAPDTAYTVAAMHGSGSTNQHERDCTRRLSLPHHHLRQHRRRRRRLEHFNPA
jgi:hypothetical protein